MTNVDTLEAPGALPPKVAGVHIHSPEYSCWICGDEAEPERGEIWASA